MKNLKFYFLFAVLLLSLSFGAVAFADTNSVESYVEKLENVEKAVSLCYGDVCVIAIQPKQLLQKSQYDELRKEIEEAVKQNNPAIREVHVTMSARAFFGIEKINKLTDENEKQKAIEQLIERVQQKPHKHMPFDTEGPTQPKVAPPQKTDDN